MTSCAADSWLPASLAGSNPRVVVAMSGGVDSSVAALLVRRAGLRCSALFMKNWHEPGTTGRCHWEDDVADALAVCEKLAMEINTVDLSAAYRDAVFADFVAEYRRGRTPNPDVLCNREIKFKAFLDEARALGADLIVTGHYVRRTRREGSEALLKGLDAGKDQSYFLYTLDQAQVTRALFPIGELAKGDVRELARAAGLPTHAKKDSTGICFIGERRFREFLAGHLPAQPGPIVTLDGHEVGQHHGAVYYTLGQREGLGIGGVRGAAPAPWFVVAKDLPANTLVVAQGHDHPALMSRALEAGTLSWVAGSAPAMPFACRAKTRYRQSDQACTVTSLGDGRVRVVFEAPQRAVTPGQSVVFYDGARMLGGGIIEGAN